MDTSWLDLDQEEDLPITGLRPTEPLRGLNVTVAYVDGESNIGRVVHDTVDLELDLDVANDALLTRARLMELIQRRRVDDAGRRYRLVHLMLFQVPLAPEQVQVFAKTDLPLMDPARCFTVFSSVQDVHIPPAVFAFHDVHRLYLVFRESIPSGSTSSEGQRTLLRCPNTAKPSRMGSAKTNGQRSTKRVAFSTPTVLSATGRHTRRFSDR